MGSLMNDFRCDTAENMMLNPLKEAVYRYKNNPEKVVLMCAELERWSLEERQEGRKEGEGRLTALLKLLKADHRWQDLDLAIEREDVRKKTVSRISYGIKRKPRLYTYYIRYGHGFSCVLHYGML